MHELVNNYVIFDVNIEQSIMQSIRLMPSRTLTSQRKEKQKKPGGCHTGCRYNKARRVPHGVSLQ